jgi:hypothetical protein
MKKLTKENGFGQVPEILASSYLVLIVKSLSGLLHVNSGCKITNLYFVGLKMLGPKGPHTLVTSAFSSALKMCHIYSCGAISPKHAGMPLECQWLRRGRCFRS